MKSICRGSIPDGLYQSAVFLYGAGITGRRVVTLLEASQIRIQYIIDDDRNKWGNKINDIEIISFQTFEEKCLQLTDVSIILTTIYGKNVLRRLGQVKGTARIETYGMYEWLDEAYDLDSLIGGLDDVEKIECFHKEISFLKNRLADEESRNVLDGIYCYMHSKDLNVISEICTENDQYYIPEVLSAIHEPLRLVDGGAYTGELYQAIQNHGLELERWYCFEASEDNYSQLVRHSGRLGLDGIQVCIQKGLWDKEGSLYFDREKGTASRIVDYETDNQIETVSLDTYFKDKSCNFIKMDIEGAEFPALQGAMEVIQRDRPILAISIYHSVEDLYMFRQEILIKF